METIYLTTRQEWRSWLEINHKSSQGVWLLYYKKHTGILRIPYADAVEEALCFGWIDSTIRRIDDQTYSQKFTPRNSLGKWSEDNIARVKKLIAEGKMMPAGLEKYTEVEKNPGRILKKPVTPERIILPDDLLEELNLHPAAKEIFCGFSNAYQNLCLRWIDSAKRKETRKKRIIEVVRLSDKREKIGMK
ncbi:MAG: YdeI/OmpD-associated family protein [Bacteroidetes bacterium]|nr:YdeI/OmpD-associated family protein [Bacteroidota bacterium]